MQFLNNDMDELMRRAAAGYEPAVTGADWDGVEQKLEAVPQAAGPIASNSRRYGLLLVFLLSSLVCNKYLYLNFNKWNFVIKETIKQHDEGFGTMMSLKEVKGVSNLSIENNTITAITPKNISKPFYNTKNVASRIGKKETASIAKSYGNEAGVASSFESGLKIRTSNYLAKSLFSIKAPFLNLVLEKSAIHILDQQKSKRDKSKEATFFYGGVVATLDASSVRFNQFHTGWQGGVLLGYQLSGKWAIETGVLWGKKSYYAEGKDFKTNKITLPTHANIIHAEGYCNMFEIPVQVKYNFKNEAQKGVFATVGASSYIMQKEEYDYLYERYNVEYYSNKYYKTSSKHFMATINLSAGYQHKIGRGTVRLEPYIKLPVQKMGVGSLPITSVGLQAGLTYPIR